jgi:hypothetical protein
MTNLVEADIDARVDSVRAWANELAPEAKLGETQDLVDAIGETVARHLEPLSKTSLAARTRLSRVVAAERVVSMFSTLRAHRRALASDVLLIADATVRNGYRRTLRAALALGADASRLARFPAPMVTTEPMASPVTYVRDRTVRAPGFLGEAQADIALPFPLVLIPPYAQTSVSSLTVVLHELGHDLDEDFGLSDCLRARLPPLGAARGWSDVEVSTWSEWLREIVADTIGGLLAGSPFAEEMGDWCDILPPTTRGTHPPTALRVRWIEGCLSYLGADVAARQLSTRVDAQHAARLAAMLDFVLGTPIPTLGGHTLADVAPAAAAQEAQIAAGATLQKDALERLPLHLVPSVARRARMRGALNVEATVRKAIVGRAAEASAAFRFASFRRQVLDRLEAPILADEEEGLKRPPPELFDRARAVAFVGASHDGLPALFQAYAIRCLPKKDRLEIFFLDDDAIRSIAHAGRSPERYAMDRARAIGALQPEILDQIASAWAIYEHGLPFVFASYWDAHEPGGRIHVSAHAWGQDVTRAPAFDFRWAAGAPVPTREYRFYLEGLSSLRQKARRLSSSHKPARR